jgi:AraC family transcriptional regulator
MEPKMVKKESVKLAGFALRTRTTDGENNREIPKFWQAYMTDGRMEKLHGESFLKSHAEYGAGFCENPENGEMVYVIGVETKDGHSIPDGYHTCTIPTALYAVFTTPPADESNFVSAIQGTWNYIYSEWLPNSGYEFDSNSVDFELYDERCMAKTDKVIDIYIPIIKKQL